MKNNSLKEAMMAALPSPQNVNGAAPSRTQPTQQAQETSPIGLGIDALSSKRESANEEEKAEKLKKHQALRPLN